MGKNLFQNTCKPEGFLGKVMIRMMNNGHAKMAKWAHSFIIVRRADRVLDIGCGGGANLATMLKVCTDGKVTGVDYSEVSVEASKKMNQKAIDAGMCEVVCASVIDLPFVDQAFDVVTAFETVYFWPGLDKAFAQVYRVLKQGGTFYICNEANGSNPADEKWTKMIDGMVIYTEEQLRGYLEGAGFHDIQVHKNEKNWMCVSARK